MDLLYEEVHAGTTSAGAALIGLLEERGDHETAERLRTLGCEPDGGTTHHSDRE